MPDSGMYYKCAHLKLLQIYRIQKKLRHRDVKYHTQDHTASMGQSGVGFPEHRRLLSNLILCQLQQHSKTPADFRKASNDFKGGMRPPWQSAYCRDVKTKFTLTQGLMFLNSALGRQRGA